MGRAGTQSKMKCQKERQIKSEYLPDRMSDGMPNNMPGRMPEKMMSEKNMGIYVRQNIRRMSHGMPGHIKIECQYIDIR